MDNLKAAIINAFLNFQIALENGRPIKDYQYIKEAICLENHITMHEIDILEVDHFIDKAILNLKLR